MVAERATPQVSSRKAPKQARSNALIAAVLEAAVQVLRTEGAARFTTARVAERAGVSVGSLYQYFPNKASILFRLQADEWQATTAMLRDILEDASAPPDQRLRELVHAFLRSECDEAQVRIALADAAPLYRDAPETGEARDAGSHVIARFIDEALPQVAPDQRRTAADLIEKTLTQVGASFSEAPRTSDEVARYGNAMADMFCAYLDRLRSAPSVRHETPRMTS